MATLNGTEELSTSEKRTQTYLATHDGEGKRLPLMNRSFLSFSFGGKFIEDFQLIVTYIQYINKNIYADFEDAVSSYGTIDGEYYWGTKMGPNHLSFTLSTDYMTQQMMDEFKYWFKPGAERDLILAEHPNRYIRARVASAPIMNMTPFGEPATIKMTNKEGTTTEYNTMTTIYRGDITLEFTMSEPFWTGILNYMPYNSRTVDNELDERLKKLLNWIIENNSLTSQDALKICLEDGIPNDINLYTDENYLLGIQKSYEHIILSRTPLANEQEKPNDENYIPANFIEEDKANAHSAYNSSEWAVVDNEETNPTGCSTLSYAPWAAADISHTDSEDSRLYNYVLNDIKGLELNQDTPQYLFYSGNAPSKPILSFTLELTIDDETGYIINPINSIGSPNKDKSYIKVGERYFYFTTPSLCTSYNKALQIIHEAEETMTVYDLKKEIREKVKDRYARKWSLYCLKDYSLETFVHDIEDQFVNDMKNFFKPQYKDLYNYDAVPIEHTRIHYYEASFVFNSKTGEARGTFSCHTPENPNEGEEITENVGDMVLSNYLIIDEKNYLDENTGLVLIKNCTPITTSENISNLMILYDNMYY